MKFPTAQQITDFFLKHPLVLGVINWAQTHSFPGFFKVPISDVAIFIYREGQRRDLTTRANSMAFSFFLSLFPALIMLFTLLPLFQEYLLNYFLEHENYYEVLNREIQAILPGEAGRSLFEFIQDITTNPQIGLLSFGFILALFFASNGMMTLMHSFDKSYLETTFKKRNGFKKRGIAVLLTVQLGLLLLVSVIFIILGSLIMTMISDVVQLDFFTKYSIYVVRWLVILALFYTGISIIYRYGAGMHRKFNFFTTGATLASLLSILSSVVFSFYVDNFGSYNKFYGSIGTIIVLMIWIQLNAFILLIGFELNASIAVNRDLKKRIAEE
ncbi:MAG: YihY/virulence factor BrkB family protein [Saprospiraceae bacterium]